MNYHYYARSVMNLLAVLLIFTLSNAWSQAGNPADALKDRTWMKSKPTDPEYYVGIGGSSLKSSGYQQIAKKNALQDLLSEIRVTVSSTSVLQQIDKDGQFKEQYETSIKTSVTDDIQNFELADTYDDGVNYWVYYRLSKKLYNQQKLAYQESSQKLALQFFDKATTAEQSQSFATAIDFYLRALLSLKNLWGEPVEVDYQGKTFYLGIESYTRLQQLLDHLSIRLASPAIQITEKSNTPFTFQILSSEKPISKIPVAISPVQLRVTPVVYFTDEQGRINALYPASWMTDNVRELELIVDLKSFAPGGPQDKFYDYLIGSLRAPGQKIRVDLQKQDGAAPRGDLFPFNKDHLTVDMSNPEKYTFKNLRLVPVRARESFKTSAGKLGYFMSLHEALESKRMTVTETDHHGSVNTLIVRNLSKDTLYIMAGEMLVGGKQDRVVAHDMLIPPHSGKVKLPVYCVERGRWDNKDDDDHGDSKFGEYYSMANKHVGKAIQKGSQHEVWEEVSKINDKNGVDSDTHAYTGHAHQVEFRGKQEEYASFFKTIFDNQSDVIGMIVVSGSAVIGSDLFLSHDLFMNAYPKLLYSYADEGITFGAPARDATEAVNTYARHLLTPELQPSFIKEKAQVFRKGEHVIHISSL